MQIGAKAKVHNKFQITVIDAATNTVKREVTAYNTVLNKMYKDLIDNSGIFGSILIGTGTGTITPESAQLINLVMSKGVVGKKLNFTNFDGTEFNITAKIIVEAGELVGETITEVGVGTGTGSYAYPETHAFLKDAEGNLIGITKSATEVLHIEATVYFNISLPNWVTNNVYPLTQERMGCSFDSVLSNWILKPGYYSLQLKTRGGSSNLIKEILSTEKNYNDRELTIRFKRYESSEGNNDFFPSFTVVREDTSTGLELNLKNKINGLQEIKDINLGVGDGIKKSFLLPNRDIKTDSLVVKTNGVAVSDFEVETKQDFSKETSYYVGVFSIYSNYNEYFMCYGGLELSNGDIALNVKSSNNNDYWNGQKILIMDRKKLIKKMIYFPDVIYAHLLYISEDFEYVCFIRSNNTIEHFRRVVEKGVENYVKEENKTIVLGYNFYKCRAPGHLDFVGHQNNKIYKCSYNESLKKYELREIPFSFDSATGASYINNLAISDDGTKIYTLYSAKLLMAEIPPESGETVFYQIADVENNTSFCYSTESITSVCPSYVFSASGGYITIRKEGHWNDAKTIQIPSSVTVNYVFPVASNVLVVVLNNHTKIIVEFDEANNITYENIPISDSEMLSKKIGNFFVNRVSTSMGKIGEYCSDKHIVHFTTPPPEGAVITASYDGLGITKTENWVIDVSLTISFSEGV